MALWLQPATVRVAGVTFEDPWTWYVLIGAVVTFAVGSLASLAFRKQSRRTAFIALPLLIVILSGASRPCDAQSKDPMPHASHNRPGISHRILPARLLSRLRHHQHSNRTEEAAGRGRGRCHNGKIVFQQAYGVRKYATSLAERSLAGRADDARHIFDMASLTKCLATATAVMQLVEQGKVDVDAPVVKYLPEFAANRQGEGHSARVADALLRPAADVDLKDAWGLAAPDKAEGMRRPWMRSSPANRERSSSTPTSTTSSSARWWKN